MQSFLNRGKSQPINILINKLPKAVVIKAKKQAMSEIRLNRIYNFIDS